MRNRFSATEWLQILRYYQAGIVNTAFGYGLFALLLWCGANVFVAQVIAHVLGVAFNYVTYSRYAFAGQQSSRSRFILSYAANYLLSLAALACLIRVIPSPYAAGLVTTVLVSLVNYVVLKRLVFARN